MLALPKLGGVSGVQNQIRASFVLHFAQLALILQAETQHWQQGGLSLGVSRKARQEESPGNTEHHIS